MIGHRVMFLLHEKTNPDYQVATRYWVDERQVLARIARVLSPAK